jgi:hypothetical protein
MEEIETKKKSIWKRVGIAGIIFFIIKGTLTTIFGISIIKTIWDWLSGLFN